MPEDLRTRLTVDTSDFQEQLKASAQATARLKLEQQALNDAYRQMGSMAAAGNAAAIDALAEHMAAAKAAEAAVKQLEAAENEESAAVRAGTSARMAANSELRLLEGNFQASTRAAGSFLSTLPGIGGAMQAAFPLFGAAAVVAILAQSAEGVAHLVDEYHSLSDAAREATIAQAQAAAAGIKELEPKVGLVERAARLFKSLTQNADAYNSIKSVGGDTVTVQTVEGLQKQNVQQMEVLRAQDRLNEAGLKGAALAKQKQADIQAEIELLQKQENATTSLVYADQQLIRSTNTTDAQKEFLSSQITSGRESVNSTNTQMDVLGLNKQAEGKLQQHANPGKEAEERLRAMEEERMQMEAEGQLSAKADHDFWAARIDAFTKGSSEYHQVLEKITRDDIEGAKAAHEMIQKYQKSQSDNGEGSKAFAESTKGIDEWRAKTEADITQTGEAWQRYHEEQAKSLEIAAQSSQAIQLEAVAIAQANSQMTRHAADIRIVSIETAEYTAKLEALRAELVRLQAQQTKDPITGQNTDSKNAAQQQQVQNSIAQLQAQQTVAAMKDSQKLTKDIAQPYMAAFTQIQTGFMRVQQQMLTGHKTFSQAMLQQEQQWALGGIEAVEKMFFKIAQQEILSLAAHTAANEAKVTSDAAAAAQTGAITALASMKEISAAAATAAAKAYSAMAGTPALAAVAAAGTFIAVEAYGAMASFDQGTNFLPTDMIAQVHAGERIIPAADNRELINAVKGGGSGKTFNNTLHYHAGSGGSHTGAKQASKMLQKQMLRAHAVMS
jgi:hypothetical protein